MSTERTIFTLIEKVTGTLLAEVVSAEDLKKSCITWFKEILSGGGCITIWNLYGLEGVSRSHESLCANKSMSVSDVLSLERATIVEMKKSFQNKDNLSLPIHQALYDHDLFSDPIKMLKELQKHRSRAEYLKNKLSDIHIMSSFSE